MKVLVTGANGFVGRWLVPSLRDAGHEVVAGVLGHAPAFEGVRTVPCDLTIADSVRELVAEGPFNRVIHLAGMASGGDARKDVAKAWDVNAIGTVRLLDALYGEVGDAARFLYVSTAEVYGSVATEAPIQETQLAEPRSPYAASKLAGELATFEVHRRRGAPVIVARSFPHTGRGQDRRFVIPAFAERLAMAKKVGAPAITVGNLFPVRDILHVSDVVEAYLALMEEGVSGEVYNVASGEGYALSDILDRLSELVGYRVVSEVDASLVRRADIPYLVGDASKLNALTGWRPRVSIDDILAEVVNAQAD